jgi:hypothetical protein
VHRSVAALHGALRAATGFPYALLFQLYAIVWPAYYPH